MAFARAVLSLVLLLPAAALAGPKVGDHVCPKVDYGASGTASVTFEVNEKGKVQNIALAKSSGNALLDRAARKCVYYWAYPADAKTPPQKADVTYTTSDAMPTVAEAAQ